MESIRRWLCPSQKKAKKHTRNGKVRKSQISSPLESLSGKQRHNTALTSGSCNTVDVATVNFTPRTQGRQATLAYLDSSRPDDLVNLLDERDRAERQAAQGPKTKGTREVQRVLREPSIKAVQQFYRVCKQAELSLRYGIAGEIAGNFSKSLGLKTNVSRLQLNDLVTTIRSPRGGFGTTSIPRTPFTPITWLDLGTPTAPINSSPPPTPISEPGGWRDLAHSDADEERESDLRSPSPATSEIDIGEGEWEVQEAQILTVTRVPIRQVRTKHIGPSKRVVYEDSTSSTT
ncbi:hypothetical protein F4804DRAFT_328816 [Jackrogersella minutella]|nr:hypothetical protein F4804DRAFT_328816 [Jackrogersella minutella]